MRTGVAGQGSSHRKPKAGRLWLIRAALLVAVVAATLAFVRHLEAGPAVLDLAPGPAVRNNESIVFFSGDTGLRRWSLGGRVAQRLARSGYSVTAVDSLAAFSRRRTPDEAAALLEQAMSAATARNPGALIVLMGQSFGSDVLPIAINRLRPDFRARIAKIILIVPGTHAYLQVSAGEILGRARPDVELTPLIGRLPDVPTTCIFGVEETDSLCPAFTAPNVRSVRLPGGHPLHRDSDAVLSVVMRALQERRPDAGKAAGQEG